MYLTFWKSVWSQQRFFWLAFAQLSLLAMTAGAQTWQWTLEDIDLAGAGTSIIADRDANLHLSYYLASGGQLKYAFRPQGNRKWFKMTVDRYLNTADSSITLDSKGNPQICYTPAAIKYAGFNGRTWSIQEVDPGSGRIAFICSIQMAADGKPMLAWYLESGTFLRYAILQEGAWLARSIDGGSSMPGKWNSMVLDANGLPRISYSDWPVGQLKYARFDGKGWLISLIDRPDVKNYVGGQRGMGNSLVLDAQGNPEISYYDEESLKCATFHEGQWRIDTVQKLPPLSGKWGWNSVRSSLVLDSKGLPHIGFQSRIGLEHAWSDGKQWHTELLLSIVGEPHFENSMTIDRYDNLYLTFRDPGNGSLRMATGHAVLDSQTAPANAHSH